MPATVYAYLLVPALVGGIIFAAVAWSLVSASRLDRRDLVGRDPDPENRKPLGHVSGQATAASWPSGTPIEKQGVA